MLGMSDARTLGMGRDWRRALACASRIATAAMTLVAAEAHGQRPYHLMTGSTGGWCLELWFPSAPAWANDIEHRVFLTGVRLGSSTDAPFVMRAAPGQAASGFPGLKWTLSGSDPSVELLWTSGFHGVTVRLTEVVPRSGDFQGEGRYWSDGPTSSWTPVAGRRVECVVP